MSVKHNRWYVIRTVLCIVLGVPLLLVAKESLLIIREQGSNFEEVVKGISDELSEDFILYEMIISDKTTPLLIGQQMKMCVPKMVILLNNRAINLYKEYQLGLPAPQTYVPSLSLMGACIWSAVQGLKNASGISYEIPLSTSIVNLQAIVKKKIGVVGVVYREFLQEYIDENVSYCKKEKIAIVQGVIPRKARNYKAELQKKLKTMLKKQRVEALWILNDNVLLKPEMIQDVWVPLVNRYKIPAIVGVEVLVQPKMNFGAFAILPDHIGLGVQAADIVRQTADNDWTCYGLVVPPVSVYKILNLKQVKKCFRVDDKALRSIDKIVQ